MDGDDGLVPDLAGAILDGTAVDWATAESSADDTERGLLGPLRRLATLADFHRGLPIQWGHLRLVEVVGRGAFAEVYRAWDTRLDREVALKLLTTAAPTRDVATSIIEEGRLLARVRHPHIVTIYGADRIDDRVGLWMEFVKGRTLEQLLQQGHRFERHEIAGIGIDLCHAVAAVHGAGLLHRDIKAHNVMRDGDGRVVLMDFGTGRELSVGGADLAGTPLYLAPEVLRGHPATVQSDIYSLGVLLYRLWTGAYPVQAATVEELRRAHDTNTRPDMRALRSSRRLAKVVAKALEPKAENRHRSAEDLGAELQRAIRAHARQRWFYGGAAAAAVIVAGVWGAGRAGWLPNEHNLPQPVASTLAVLGLTAPSVLPDGQRPVIAVAPVRNETGDPETDLVVDGLRYEVVRSIAQLEGLEVRSAPYPSEVNAPTDARTFGRSLGANLVLEASVFRSAGGLRLRGQLTRIEDNTVVLPIAAESTTADALVLQEQISLAIVNRLRLRGLGTRRYQLDPRLSNLFLTARALQARRHTANAGRAAELFEQIIAADPDFAPAHAGLASALGAFATATPTAEAPPPDPRLRPAARRAIELDPFLAEAHSAMGSLYARDRDWNNARASFTKAIELEPTLTTAHSEFVLMVLLPLGETDEALRVMEAASRADRLSLDVRRISALVQIDAGRYDQAIENARWVLERDAQFPYAELSLARALMLSGRTEEAAPLLKNKHWSYLGYLYAITGRRAEAEAMIAARPNDAAGHMLVLGGLNDANRALAALDRAFKMHWWRAATWVQRPEVAILRDDPRARALRIRMGLLR